jgi:hypothetical protein
VAGVHLSVSSCWMLGGMREAVAARLAECGTTAEMWQSSVFAAHSPEMFARGCPVLRSTAAWPTIAIGREVDP